MRFLLLPMVAAFAIACQTTATIHNRLVTAFDDAVFYVAPDQSGQKVVQKVSKLARWEQPVLIGLEYSESADDALIAHIKQTIDEIRPLIPVAVRLMEPDEIDKANLKVRIEDKDDFTINRNQAAACYAHVRANDNGTINKVDVVLPGRRPQAAISCFAHELMHAIGFRGHTHSINSTLSYVSPKEEFTQWDMILIKLLYHPGMKAGMDRESSLAKARMLIGGLYR